MATKIVATWRVVKRESVKPPGGASGSVILLPLQPAYLMHKNPQRRTKVHGVRPIGCKDLSINQSEDVFVEYPVHVISVAVVQRCTSLLVFVVLYKRISFTCLAAVVEKLDGAIHRINHYPAHKC